MADFLTDLLDDTHRFVADERALIVLLGAAVEPEVRSADGSMCYSDDSIGRLFNLGAVFFFDSNIARSVINCCFHRSYVVSA
ncbi:hypothetical protein C458_01580 [Haloferax sp. ATCC BAA-644]|nr:hypothetical protein C459_15186 [Haloferax sp. ATCC BAA-645]ELZ62088.1 hypothetical protein C460_00160 [Haloferax sp. ATCC BAA-646]ELZ71328.1 hypothetical protein C458_01580 [Haloferax sp. ATCC BAA-644]